jgi:hypothetical protein
MGECKLLGLTRSGPKGWHVSPTPPLRKGLRISLPERAITFGEGTYLPLPSASKSAWRAGNAENGASRLGLPAPF